MPPLVQVDETGHKEELGTAECIARDLCPECGHSLKLESPTAHLNMHWQGGTISNPYAEKARERRQALLDYIANRASAAVKPIEARKPAESEPAKKE